MLRRRKSAGPNRSEMRPQWFVRPPSIRARNQSNVVPGAFVYGSPGRSQPPMQPSNSPNGFSAVDAPRRGELYGQVSMAESVVLSHGPPASSTVTLTPARVSTYAAIPPPAPEPTMTTSAGELCVARRIQGSLVAECTAGVAWIGNTDPPAGGLLYRGNNPAAAA